MINCAALGAAKAAGWMAVWRGRKLFSPYTFGFSLFSRPFFYILPRVNEGSVAIMIDAGSETPAE